MTEEVIPSNTALPVTPINTDVEVTFKNQHTHAGIIYQKGDKIKVSKDIEAAMKKLGAI